MEVVNQGGAFELDGVAFLVASKQRGEVALFVVLAVEVGGTIGFITELTRARASSETAMMRKRPEQADAIVSPVWVPRQRCSQLLCWICKVLWEWFRHAGFAAQVRSKGQR